jgi:SAM-dependent methyltransferase
VSRPPRRGFFSRSRGLEALEEHFHVDVAAFVTRRQAQVPDVRVLEIGCGEGRALMELRRRFPAIELHGINLRPWPAMRGQASLRRTGTYYKIFTRRELADLTLPSVHFYDATRLRFEDATLDLIISQRAIHYFERKDTVIEEAWRTLRPGGLALLQIDERRPVMPDFFVGDTPRFIVYDGGRPVPLARHLAAIRARGFGVALYHEDRAGFRLSSVCMSKSSAAPLSLGLAFDADSSITLEQPGKPREVYWGFRSVYRVRP